MSIIAQKNPEIKVIVLKSGGERAFCAGASFDELIQINNLKQGERFFSGFADVINAIRKCPKFIIGRVQGKTVGGGVGIESLCPVQSRYVCSDSCHPYPAWDCGFHPQYWHGSGCQCADL